MNEKLKKLAMEQNISVRKYVRNLIEKKLVSEVIK